MPITVNEGGTLYTLDTVYANEGGTLYELDTVYDNEDGTLQEIFSTWSAPDNISGSYSVSKANGQSANYGSFTLTHDTRVTVSMTDISCSGGTSTRFAALRVKSSDGSDVIIHCGEDYLASGTSGSYSIGVLSNPASAILSAGTYDYDALCVNLTGGQTMTYYSASFKYTITFSKP